MNREQKAAVIDEVATQIKESEAVFAVDYRGISVPQAATLRERLEQADATLRVVKNTLTERAVEQAGAEGLKDLLEGPTAFTFVRGDAALAAKVIATFRRENQVLEFKGGTMDGAVLSIEQIEAISRLPTREVLHGQMVGVLASPITGLVRGLHQLIQGLASQLGQIAEQRLVSGEDAPAAAEEAPATEAPVADEAPAGDSGNAPTEGEDPAEGAPAAEEASGDQPAESDDTDAQPAEPAASQEEG
jgi:large subunit ribosomal protein L10